MSSLRNRATTGEALEWAAHFLGESGVSEPKLHASLLLAASELKSDPNETGYLERLRVIRLRHTAHPEAPIAHPIRFKRLSQQRATGVPTAYLLCAVEFMGLEFSIYKRALIPRP